MFKGFSEALQAVAQRYAVVRDALAQTERLDQETFIKYSREFSDLEPLIQLIEGYHAAQKGLQEAEDILADSSADAEFRDLADQDRATCKEDIVRLEQKIAFALIPKDADDDRNVIVEIRAGTGGDEAALFAGDLFRMYTRYAERQRWRVDIDQLSETGMGGVKEVVMTLEGRGAYANLKFESGVHRVQRVPDTESSGRIHTSAATVAVLPEVEEVDLVIHEKDLRIDVFRSSGPGGQSVNTTDSAVRITHIPTGVVVQQQDEKSQHKNKAKALKILRARLYEEERRKTMEARAGARKSQVGSGDRSERIRTYNFPQSRVTDHRIQLTLYKLAEIMDGDLSEMIESLTTADQAEKLAALE
jgi:peptide chain release factor 1